MNSEEYNAYFNNRWLQYSRACLQHPDALQQEFQVAVDVLNVQAVDRILNIPAAYNDIISAFRVVPQVYDTLETSAVFSEKAGILWSNWCPLNVKQRYTKILSLASLHHLDRHDRLVFFQECFRCLEDSGSLVVGDVKAGSPQAVWLNGFVDQYNSFGHKGLFWSAEDAALFQEAGFQVELLEKDYEWTFSNKEGLLDFVRDLFGLDKPLSDSELWSALSDCFSLNGYNLPWKLLYYRATKVCPFPVPSPMKSTDSHLLV